MSSYEYHKFLKFLYFEGYANSYEEAEYLLEEISDEDYDNLCSLYVREVINELSQTEITTAIGAEKNLTHSFGKSGHEAPGYKYGGRRAPNREGSGQVPEQKRFAQDIRAAQQRSIQRQSYEYEADLIEGIIGYLLDEGYAETADAAEVILSNMSEQWLETILEMDDFSAGGGNAKMKQTGMSRAEVEALGKKNLARKASSNTSSASTKAPEAPKQQLGATEADYKIAKLNKPKEPVKYGQQVSKGEGPKRYADSGKVTARHKFHSYQDSQNRADTIASWYGLDRKNPETQKKMKDWADTNYRQNIAVDSDDPNYDPTKTSYPKFTPAKRDSRSAWNKLG